MLSSRPLSPRAAAGSGDEGDSPEPTSPPASDETLHAEPTSTSLVTTAPVETALAAISTATTPPSTSPSLTPTHAPHIDIIAPGAVITNACSPKHERVAILDAGAQYGKVIDRRVRELCVQSDLLPLSTPPHALQDYAALIISGGPQSVYGPAAPAFDPEIIALGKPVLGICYGMQLLNVVSGGTVAKKAVREDGQFNISIDTSSPLYASLPSRIDVLLTHGDSVDRLAPRFTATATTPSGLVCSLEDREHRLYGVQFHPEVDLTPQGKDVLLNFLASICRLPRTFSLHSRLDAILQEVKEEVGADKTVLMLLSGGVDSSVCAALLKRAIGAERIVALHIDNGFMRQDESAKVALALRSIGLPLTVVDARQDFYSATTTIKGETTLPLCQTLNPEHKRKIIGDTFMRVSAAHIAQLQLTAASTVLAQGTLRPDLIESASHLASSNADVIKTHHNDTEMVRTLRKQGRIVEPLKDLHKDEVRQLGLQLGLPHALVWRQPFPGPGLAIRIICQQQAWRGDNWEELLSSLRQYEGGGIHCSLLPCRTVGVQGDQRTYSGLVCLSCDGDPQWSELFRLAKEIPKHCHGVNRVVFAFGAALPGGFLPDVTPTTLTPDVIALLQRCDEEVNDVLLSFSLLSSLSQVPVVLFPASMGEEGKRSICIRTFITNDFMTGVPARPGKDIPAEAVQEMVQRVSAVPGIARVCFDLTSKPPATTEWE